MQIKCSILILTILLLSPLYFPANLYSTITPIATNQNFASLPNVSFTIYCNSEKDERMFERLAVVENSKKICTSDSTGRCYFGINQGISGCFGCTASSSAIVTAKYYSQELNQSILQWNGYACVSPDERCCYASSHELSKRYYKEPSNRIEPFVFNTYSVLVNVTNVFGEPLKNAEVIANSPDAFYSKCYTDENGRCVIENIPENARYDIKTTFKSMVNETGLIVTNDISIQINLTGKNENIFSDIPINNTTMDGCNGQCSEYELCTYSPLNNNYGCCKLGEQWTGEKCVQQSALKIFILPINYDRTAKEFNSVLNKVNEMDKQINLGYSSYYFIDRSLKGEKEYCDESGMFRFDVLEKHFLEWYKQTRIFNQNLQPSKDKYRILAIDFASTCSNGLACGYAARPSFLNRDSTVIYTRHDEECESPHIAMHEFGHTFGLCDDYNPYAWELQNGIFATCPNPKPNSKNSKFLIECSPDGGACTFGVEYGNNYYSTMGSSDIYDENGNAIKRKFGLESILHIQEKIEEVNAK